MRLVKVLVRIESPRASTWYGTSIQMLYDFTNDVGISGNWEKDEGYGEPWTREEVETLLEDDNAVDGLNFFECYKDNDRYFTELVEWSS